MSNFEAASYCTLSEYQAWEPSRVLETELKPKAVHMAMFLLNTAADKCAVKYPSRILGVDMAGSISNGLHLVRFALLDHSGDAKSYVGYGFNDGYATEPVVPIGGLRLGDKLVRTLYFRGEDEVFSGPWNELRTALPVPAAAPA